MRSQFSIGGHPVYTSGFLFDKDGTLLSFNHWLAVMRERALRIGAELALGQPAQHDLLRFMGLNPTGGREGAWGIIPLPRCDAEEATAAYLATQGRGAYEAMRDLTARVFRDVDAAFPFEQHLRPTPGAGDGLRAIRVAHARTAIVTHDIEAAALRHLAALGWTNLVDAVVGLDGCLERKPSPEPVLSACRALGLRPEETVMVGDTVTDLLAGRAAGCQLTVGVLTGLGTWDELQPVADIVVPDLSALAFAPAG